MMRVNLVYASGFLLTFARQYLLYVGYCKCAVFHLSLVVAHLFIFFCTNVQADLNFRLAHMSDGMFLVAVYLVNTVIVEL